MSFGLRISFISMLLFGLVSSCNNNRMRVGKNEAALVNYIHISHTRTAANPKLDSMAEQINFKEYEMLWLGGDLAHATSLDNETMIHVDSIFDLGNNNTLWALGNHDYSDLKRVEEFTKRPPYYAFTKNNITFLVLDTQDSLSSIVGDQKKLFDSVLDTIEVSSHLVLLHHKLIWMYDHEDLEPRITTVSNAKLGSCGYCINPNNFYEVVYPRLVEVKQKGIEVLCIGGDIGFKAGEFEYVTKDGIYFLASGISFQSTEGRVMIINHDVSDKTLNWEFKAISDLQKAAAK